MLLSGSGMSPEIYAWVILPIIIFCARVVDVSLGTLRIVFVARGKKALAPILGFFEVLIWIVIIGQVVQNLDSPVSYIAYAGGFATGNWVGLMLEDKLALGTLMVRVFVTNNAQALIDRLQAAGYGVTLVDAHGTTGDVQIVYSVIKRKNLPVVMEMVRQVAPKAFTAVDEIRSTAEGVFPVPADPAWRRLRLATRGRAQ